MSNETPKQAPAPAPAPGIQHSHPPCPCEPVQLLDGVIYMFKNGYVCRW